jgi:hypothetical protein
MRPPVDLFSVVVMAVADARRVKGRGLCSFNRFSSLPCCQQALDVIMDDLSVVRFRHGALRTQLFGILDGALDGSGQQHVNSWTMFSNPFRQAKSINGAGHFDVTENDIDNRFFVQEHGHRLFCIHSFDYPVPAVSKVLRDGYANQDFVLYKEDCFWKVGLVGHAKQRVTPGVSSSAQKHLDVLDQAPSIIRLWKKAISGAPITRRERLARS